jgi:hypothetical protein
MLEFKRLGVLKSSPEVGKIPEQEFQLLEYNRPSEESVIFMIEKGESDGGFF